VGLEQLLAWGVDRIAATLAAKTAAIAERAATLGLQAAPAHFRAGHYLGLRFPRGAPQRLPERLAERRVYVSVRGDSLRVTPHLYNHEQDLDRLLEVLHAVL
jgi:selenocysteine lyase/cysteine desulfurase